MNSLAGCHVRDFALERLAATALGRKSCPVAAFYDDELNALFDLNGEEENVLYLAPVG